MFNPKSNDKNSVYDDVNGRYVIGGTTEVSATAIEWWEKKPLAKDASDVFYTVEKKFEGRADLIAHTFYGTTHLWWLVCQYNALLDPLEEIVVGTVLRLPTPDRIALYKNGATTGGIPSTRL